MKPSQQQLEKIGLHPQRWNGLMATASFYIMLGYKKYSCQSGNFTLFYEVNKDKSIVFWIYRNGFTKTDK